MRPICNHISCVCCGRARWWLRSSKQTRALRQLPKVGRARARRSDNNDAQLIIPSRIVVVIVRHDCEGQYGIAPPRRIGIKHGLLFGILASRRCAWQVRDGPPTTQRSPARSLAQSSIPRSRTSHRHPLSAIRVSSCCYASSSNASSSNAAAAGGHHWSALSALGFG